MAIRLIRPPSVHGDDVHLAVYKLRTSPISPRPLGNVVVADCVRTLCAAPQWRNHARDEFGLGSLRLYMLEDGTIDLDQVVVEQKHRGQGRGSAFMRALATFADRHGRRIVLTPASSRDTSLGTTSRARLVRFYKQFGFVENKGRARDFALRPGVMVRSPRPS